MPLFTLVLRLVAWAHAAQPSIEFSASTYTTGESEGAAALTMLRSGDSGSPVTADSATTDGNRPFQGPAYRRRGEPFTAHFGAIRDAHLAPLIGADKPTGSRSDRDN